MCYYGDDFTGSTDAMEALTLNGFRTVLFLRIPEKEEIEQQFSDIDCFGVAGLSRQMTPKQMDEQLKPDLEKMKEFDIPIVHYKVCSTFDSAKNIGNIGKVVEISQDIFTQQRKAIVSIGVPQLKRYVIFGNLFAEVNQKVYRLDRHPTMSKHPVTPMNESDLGEHLNKQTTLKSDFINVLELENHHINVRFQEKLSNDADILIMDTLNKEHLTTVARLINNESEKYQQFVIGSSGIEYGLSSYWNMNAKGKKHNTLLVNEMNKSGPLLVVSGSCSPVTKSQIEYSLENNFVGMKVDCPKLIRPESSEKYLNELIESANKGIFEGKDVIIYTALGPNDEDIKKTNYEIERLGLDNTNTGEILGSKLGRLVKEVILQTKINRIVSAGGDTSGNVIKELGLFAIEMLREVHPGGPLCKSYAKLDSFNNLEIALKGGQVGEVDYFVKVANLS